MKQIGAVSSLGEFEVCKVLAAALVVGALTGGGVSGVAAHDDAFSFPAVDQVLAAPTAAPPSFGAETVGVPVSASEPAEQEPISYDTIFQAAVKPPPPPAEESERTVFEPVPPTPGPSAPDLFSSTRTAEPPRRPAASQLLIDEPEPDTSDDSHARRPPRPKKMRGGGVARGGNGGGMVKWLGAAVLVGAAAFSVYYFVWPMVFPESGPKAGSATASTATRPTPNPTPQVGANDTAAPSASATSTAPAASTSPTTPGGAQTSGTPVTGPATTDPRATGVPPSGAAATPSGAPSPSPKASSRVPGGSTSPNPPSTAASAPRATTSAPPAPRPTPTPSGVPKPLPTPPSSGTAPAGGGGRALLQSGKLDAAARAFQQEILSTGSRKFTIAIGLYCNEENAGRIVEGAAGSSQIYVLPASVQGRSCYRIVWGLFDTADAAERGMGSVPNAVHGGDAAVVAVARFLQ